MRKKCFLPERQQYKKPGDSRWNVLFIIFILDYCLLFFDLNIP